MKVRNIHREALRRPLEVRMRHGLIAVLDEAVTRLRRVAKAYALKRAKRRAA